MSGLQSFASRPARYDEASAGCPASRLPAALCCRRTRSVEIAGNQAVMSQQVLVEVVHILEVGQWTIPGGWRERSRLS